MKLKQIEAQLLSLTPEEKNQAIQLLAESLHNNWKGITKNPNISGGDACIANTRIPVWLLVSLRRQGSTDAELLQFYPHLSAIDLVNASCYAANYPEEIEQALREEAEAMECEL